MIIRNVHYTLLYDLLTIVHFMSSSYTLLQNNSVGIDNFLFAFITPTYHFIYRDSIVS